MTSDNKLQVTVGTKVISSSPLAGFQPGQMDACCSVCKDVRKTVSAFYNFSEVISAASVNAYTGTGRIEWSQVCIGSGQFTGVISIPKLVQLSVNRKLGNAAVA